MLCRTRKDIAACSLRESSLAGMPGIASVSGTVGAGHRHQNLEIWVIFNLLNGRSGGIRTHDPQSPRLMRYQAALRSDWSPI